jgi:hypothetical protein
MLPIRVGSMGHGSRSNSAERAPNRRGQTRGANGHKQKQYPALRQGATLAPTAFEYRLNREPGRQASFPAQRFSAGANGEKIRRNCHKKAPAFRLRCSLPPDLIVSRALLDGATELLMREKSRYL